jgi:large subunit ribosomal protein L17
MRHLNAHRKLGRTSEHRMSMLRNMATSLINARDERIVTTVPKAKELRPFVERVITLAKRASGLEGDDAAAQSLHLRRQAAGFFHAGNRQQAPSTGRRKQPRAPRTAGVAALKRLFEELGKRYQDRPGGYTRIIRLGHRDGDNAELAIIELVDNPREREAAQSATKRSKSASSAKKKSAKKGGKADTSDAGSTKKESKGGRRSKKTESTAAEQETE